MREREVLEEIEVQKRRLDLIEGGRVREEEVWRALEKNWESVEERLMRSRKMEKMACHAFDKRKRIEVEGLIEVKVGELWREGAHRQDMVEVEGRIGSIESSVSSLRMRCDEERDYMSIQLGSFQTSMHTTLDSIRKVRDDLEVEMRVGNSKTLSLANLSSNQAIKEEVQKLEESLHELQGSMRIVEIASRGRMDDLEDLVVSKTDHLVVELREMKDKLKEERIKSAIQQDNIDVLERRLSSLENQNHHFSPISPKMSGVLDKMGEFGGVEEVERHVQFKEVDHSITSSSIWSNSPPPLTASLPSFHHNNNIPSLSKDQTEYQGEDQSLETIDEFLRQQRADIDLLLKINNKE